MNTTCITVTKITKNGHKNHIDIKYGHSLSTVIPNQCDMTSGTKP